MIAVGGKGGLAIALVSILAVGAVFIWPPWIARIVVPSLAGFLGMLVPPEGAPSPEDLLAELAFKWAAGVFAGALLGAALRSRVFGVEREEEGQDEQEGQEQPQQDKKIGEWGGGLVLGGGAAGRPDWRGGLVRYSGPQPTANENGQITEH
jgi:hypothetical protein